MHPKKTAVLLLLAVIPGAVAAAAAARADQAHTSFLVVAPDRGFLGNEETREAFGAFAGGRQAALVFVTDERTRSTLEGARPAILRSGIRRVVVLPFFLSRSDPRFRRAESLVRELIEPQAAVVWSRPFGESCFATEVLAERLRGVEDRRGRRLVVVGAGAQDEESRRAMAADWQRLAEAAADGMGFESVRVVVAASREAVGAALAAAVEGGERPVVVPFHLGSKLDGMMSFTAELRRQAPHGAEVENGDVSPHPAIAIWMTRETNRHLPLRPHEVGVAVLAHGADYHWNEAMRRAAEPLARDFLVEPAFSMADRQVIEHAIRRLEQRGARLIVVLRVFGLSASFRDDVERLIGLDIERGRPARGAGGATHHGHGHEPGEPPRRILSSAVLTTTGGLEDHPLFAEALLDRARALSRDPARETVILVAHGEGDDARDLHWRAVLGSLAARMRENGGGRFRSILAGTWREDWPDKREAAAEEVRRFVREAAAGGGRAIVVPARTLGQGPERRLLEGLDFELGEGFIPHPLFARWAEEQVRAALAELQGTSPARAARGEESTPDTRAANRR